MAMFVFDNGGICFTVSFLFIAWSTRERKSSFFCMAEGINVKGVVKSEFLETYSKQRVKKSKEGMPGKRDKKR